MASVPLFEKKHQFRVLNDMEGQDGRTVMDAEYAASGWSIPTAMSATMQQSLKPKLGKD